MLQNRLHLNINPVLTAVGCRVGERLSRRDPRDQRPEISIGEIWFDMQRGHRQQLVAAVPELLDGALVHIHESQRVPVNHQHRIADRVQDPLDLTGLGLSGASLTDVSHRGDDPQPGIGAQRTEADLDREVGTVTVAPEELHTGPIARALGSARYRVRWAR